MTLVGSVFVVRKIIIIIIIESVLLNKTTLV